MPQIASHKDLDQLLRNARAVAVLGAWSGGGLFKALSDGAVQTAAELPGDDRAIEITAPILVSLGLLQSEGRSWRLSAIGRTLYESGQLNMGTSERLLGDLSRLDSVLTEGGPVRGADGNSQVTEGGVREENPDDARRFMNMLYRRSGDSAVHVAEWMAERLEPGAHVLDLGGGHGRYGHELAQRGFTVTLFDRPICVALATERFGDAVRMLEGDFMSDPLGGPYDAVLLSNIIHGLGDQENAALLQRLSDATSDGGLLVLKDLFVDRLGAYPENAVFFGLIMLMYTREGRTYNLDDASKLMQDTGWEPGGHVLVPDGGYTLFHGIKA